jgi:hypothetical protein
MMPDDPMRARPRQSGLLLRITPLIAAILVAFGCGDPGRPPQVKRLRALLAERLPPFQPDKLPEQKRRFREAAVYVDGKPIGVLKHSELPPTLPLRKQRLADGREVPRWRFSEYLTAAGVPFDRVRAAHFLGGRDRAAIVAGDELRKQKDTLVFSFTRGDAGKPRVHWPPGIVINTSIDTIVAVTLYVDKEPPTYKSSDHSFSFADGKPIEGVPYALPEEALKGTRVYVDGALVSAMKRKTLPNSMLVPGSEESAPRFSLDAWLTSAGVDPAAARATDLLSGEDVITRLGPKEWGNERKSLAFSLPRRSQGRILLHLPKDDAAVIAAGPAVADPSLRVSAIMIYKNVTPSKRPVAPLAELVAAEPPGSGNDQGGAERPANGPGSGAARDMHNDDNE